MTLSISRFRFAALFLMVALSACGGRVEGVLEPLSNPVSGTTAVDMLVATTREKATDPAVLFSGERGPALALTDIRVSIPPDAVREIGQVQWPARLPADPATEFATIRVAPVDGLAGARAWLGRHLPRSRRVMIFVHGFNNRYEDSVYRFAQIVHDSGAQAAPVVFTWPSRGSVFDYNYDKESTNYSRDALENVIRGVAATPGVGEVTILAHSMGTWLAVEALRQMAIRDGRIAPRISNVILASPDLDVDVFARQWRAMGEKRPKFTIFVSQDDHALRLSRLISGRVDRLGQVDPTVEPYRSAFEREGITVLDLTKLRGGDSLNHGKFAESPEVVKLIGQRLIAGQTVTDSDVGFGERIGGVALGAAQTVGSAASLVVSTPLAIVDGRTRRNYGEQVDRLGRSMSGTLGAAANTMTAPLQR